MIVFMPAMSGCCDVGVCNSRRHECDLALDLAFDNDPDAAGKQGQSSLQPLTKNRQNAV